MRQRVGANEHLDVVFALGMPSHDEAFHQAEEGHTSCALAATHVNDLASGGNPYSVRVLRGTRAKRVGLSPSRSDWLTENTHAGLYEFESTAGVNQGARAGVSPR
jgi:hypothetical protein